MKKFKHPVFEAADFFKKHFKLNTWRKNQLTNLLDILPLFSPGKINCIETGASQDINDGCFGAFFAKLSELTGGEFHSVDLSKSIVNKSKKFFKNLNLKVNHNVGDSVEFLNNTKVIPNLVHLDSYDINIKNPFPSALHCWREFIAIENKMPIGSVLIIDDNWFMNTWVEYTYDTPPERKGDIEKVTINYPIIGKGSNVYHYIEEGNSNWRKLSKDLVGNNVKLIYQKVKL